MSEWCPYLRKITIKESPSYPKILGMFCLLCFREVKTLIIADNSDERKNAIYFSAKPTKS